MSFEPMPAISGLEAGAESKVTLEVVIVVINSQRFAFLLRDLVSVLRSKITTLPGLNPVIAGLINVQGELVSVLELSLLLGLVETSSQDDCVLLVFGQYGKVGLRVPRLPELETIDPGLLTTMLDHEGISQGKIALLDLDQVLPAPVLQNNV